MKAVVAIKEGNPVGSSDAQDHGMPKKRSMLI
jgi:hypothetical protein